MAVLHGGAPGARRGAAVGRSRKLAWDEVDTDVSIDPEISGSVVGRAAAGRGGAAWRGVAAAGRGHKRARPEIDVESDVSLTRSVQSVVPYVPVSTVRATARLCWLLHGR